MPFALEQLTQGLSLAAAVNPATLNGSTGTSGAVDVQKFRRIMGVVLIGANSGSVTAKFQSSSTSGGSYADVSGGPTVTAITTANQQASIELRDDQLAAGQRYVKLLIIEGNSANAICAGVILGGEAEQKPAKANDPTSVNQRNVM
jgi:hypothetical protein